jgi:N-acetylglutamate synthase-like GNAT family acetyltransferase
MNNMHLKYRRAEIDDIQVIVSLLLQDELGKTREITSDNLDKRYIDAFQRINDDPNQYLMVVEIDNKIIGTCHLTIMPSLTFTGSTRMQIEAVRVHQAVRGKQIGECMITEAFNYAKSQGVKIIQLSTNKQRPDALRFYEKLGFEASHIGMKLYLDK